MPKTAKNTFLNHNYRNVLMYSLTLLKQKPLNKAHFSCRFFFATFFHHHQQVPLPHFMEFHLWLKDDSWVVATALENCCDGKWSISVLPCSWCCWCCIVTCYENTCMIACMITNPKDGLEILCDDYYSEQPRKDSQRSCLLGWANHSAMLMFSMQNMTCKTTNEKVEQTFSHIFFYFHVK